MLTIEPEPKQYAGQTLAEIFKEDQATTIQEKIKSTINAVKTLPINGCITGSCMLPTFDPEGWSSTPDVDVFVFGEGELYHMVDLCRYALRMEPGMGTPRSRKQEEWKLGRLNSAGLNRKIGITTYKFYYDGVIINVTHKMSKHGGHWIPALTTADVLSTFDMSIVMQGYDIKHHVHYDMRVGDPMVAIPNPLREQDCMLWTVAKWVRQFDRVIKYYNRGFDTRPMAEFYLKMIDEAIKVGNLFDSEESKDRFESMSHEFIEKRAAIAEWLEEHKED